MRILVLCDHGANRSVTLAHQLRYLPNVSDVWTAGLKTNTPELIRTFVDLADKTILTAKDQVAKLQKIYGSTPLGMELWNCGPDNYPRPFNPTMLRIAQGLVKQKRHQLENTDKLHNGRLGVHFVGWDAKRGPVSPVEALEERKAA